MRVENISFSALRAAQEERRCADGEDDDKADDGIYFQHKSSGISRWHNDIDVFAASIIPMKMSTEEFSGRSEYTENREIRKMFSRLLRLKNTNLPLFLNSVQAPCDDDGRYFVGEFEARWKNIERAFGFLQTKWHILAIPSR